MGKIIVIPADMAEPVTTRDADRQPSIERLHAWVGGFIELVPHWEHHNGRPCVAFCNEEGKLHELPVNHRATMMWWNVLGRRVDDVLVGTVVLLIDLPDDEEAT